MASVATDASRKGTTLQGYDLVIALSQANINETLRRHFTALGTRDGLDTFEAETGTFSITAQILAPTIDLVDKDNSKGALYVIHFGKGFYTTAIEVGKKYERIQIPTDGWELAFDVDIDFKPVLKSPDHISRKVPFSGGYSVQQLMINFKDTTRIFPLDAKRFKFSIPDSSKDLVKSTTIEAGLEHFLRHYLKDKLQKKDSHNIIGYAVQIDHAPHDREPQFLPTDSKVQIVGHRSEGKAESSCKDSPKNAFCFTQMTRKRVMPSTEVRFSGNWFKKSVGGKLAISRALFWDSFMVDKIKDAHVKAVEQSCTILDIVTDYDFPGKAWWLDSSKPSRAAMCGPYKGSASWGDLAYSTSYKSSEFKHRMKEDPALCNLCFSPRSTVHTVAKPSARKGEIAIQQDIETGWELSCEPSEDFFRAFPVIAAGKLACSLSFGATLKLMITTTFSLEAVPSTGKLQVGTNSEITRMDYRSPQTRHGILAGFFPADDDLNKFINKQTNKMSSNHEYEKQWFRDQFKILDSTFMKIASELQNDLNKLNQFIFPGSGTFDLKDPIFSDKGDLMLGLSYR
ncbi:MAG: hypothetical protein Q9195_007388 [Heterodermia aff. obscurata]